MFSRITVLPTLTLSARLLLRLIGSAILLILVCGAGVVQLTHADQRIQDVVGETLSPVADLGRIQNDYNDIMQALVHATLTQLPSAVDDAVTIIKDNRLDIQRHWSPLSHSGLARQQQLLQLTVRHRADADATVDETLQLLNASQFNIAQLKLSNDVQSAFVPLKSDFSNLFSLALAQGQTQAAVQHADNRRGLIGLLILLGVALAVAAWIDLAIIRSLGRRLRRASAVASRIAKGVLGDHIDLGHADEIGVLLQALARMDAQLESVVAQVRERASTVEHSAIGIAQGNESLNRRTQAQATLLESAALAMTRMAAAVTQGVQHANQADAAATDAHTQAAQGSEVASEAIGSMKEIERTSRQMSEVLDLVDQVAFQTRLLALNAAVEAARAGSHGRGFAVVAAEVRELAQRCGQASKDIRQLITESDEAVRAGTVLVSQTGSMLESIASSINRLSRLVGSMSATGRGHASDIGTINHVVMDIDTMTQENAALVEEAAAASHAMQQSAGTLLLEVDFFTLKSDRSSEHIERQGDVDDVDDDEKLSDSREPVEAISA